MRTGVPWHPDRSAYYRAYRDANREKVTAQKRDYYQKNKGRLADLRRENGRKEDAETQRLASRRRYWENKEKVPPGMSHWKKWSEPEKAYLRSAYGTVPVAEIAEVLGRTYAAVMARATMLSLVKKEFKELPRFRMKRK